MSKDEDGFIVLDDDDICGVDALIATLDIHVRGSRSYTVQEASRFVREWEYMRRSHARDDGCVLEDDEC